MAVPVVVYPHRYNSSSSSSSSTTTPNNSGKKTIFLPTQLPARYTGPRDDEMTPQQHALQQEIIDTRPRTGLAGPFGPWLAVPAVAAPSIALGTVCRSGTSLTPRESELLILLTGAYYNCLTEFLIHKEEGLQAGLSEPLIAAIPWRRKQTNGIDDTRYDVEEMIHDRVLPLLEDERERAIVVFAANVLANSGVITDAVYETTKRTVQDEEKILVEITSIIGYYTYVAYTLNVFRIPYNK